MRLELGESAAARLTPQTVHSIQAEYSAFERLVSGRPLESIIRIDLEPRFDAGFTSAAGAVSEEQGNADDGKEGTPAGKVLLTVDTAVYRYSIRQARQAASLASGTPGLPAVGLPNLWRRVVDARALDHYVIELARSVTTEHPELLVGSGPWQEWLFNCSKSITIAVEPGYLRVLSETAQEWEVGLLSQIRTSIGLEVGLSLPTFELYADSSLPPGGFAVWINGLRTTAFLGLDPLTVFASMTGEQREDALLLVNRSRGHLAPRDQSPEIASSSFAALTALEYMAVSIESQIRSHAHWLMDSSRAAEMISDMRGFFPSVARATDELVGMNQLAGTLAQLLAEDIPVRQLHSICEGLLEWRTRVPVVDRSPSRLVRDRLAPAITARASRAGSIMVWLLGPTFRTDIETAPAPALEALCADLQGAAEIVESMGGIPALLVTEELRVFLQEPLRVALPEVRLLSFDDVPSRQSILVTGQTPNQ